jgi:hypothetical protein
MYDVGDFGNSSRETISRSKVAFVSVSVIYMRTFGFVLAGRSTRKLMKSLFVNLVQVQTPPLTPLAYLMDSSLVQFTSLSVTKTLMWLWIDINECKPESPQKELG